MGIMYTTVTVNDFADRGYIQGLIGLNIGIEVALLTQLPVIAGQSFFTDDLKTLQGEILRFKEYLHDYGLSPSEVRVHQPGGYSYDWSKPLGFKLLQQFFSFCATLGFTDYIVHAPVGDLRVNEEAELSDYKQKLAYLAAGNNLEVEEIRLSYHNWLSSRHRRYVGELYEKLMVGHGASVLLDTYECGGVPEYIERIKSLSNKGLKVRSVHVHKDNHKFLTLSEFNGLFPSNFNGNLVNEGFVANTSSFEEFRNNKSVDCVMDNGSRLNILEGYVKILHSATNCCCPKEGASAQDVILQAFS
ncbi:TIM alpha/beta-barrel protein [Geotalea daltonii FRC-32]|uniref:TIM alpha/beta-barrel protein n=1 Tax=Geotalea daltonii (strain DSM 22248 / JCM 15807 / FRC-32) TaxID=316067 RepID=B9LZY3_GEODF|nr:hypothetical protein [Geotalea daltonii]ACM20763.1 TIM alpha/beta-barrel protein [Geotalea daltonii FRC-32]